VTTSSATTVERGSPPASNVRTSSSCDLPLGPREPVQSLEHVFETGRLPVRIVDQYERGGRPGGFRHARPAERCDQQRHRTPAAIARNLDCSATRCPPSACGRTRRRRQRAQRARLVRPARDEPPLGEKKSVPLGENRVGSGIPRDHLRRSIQADDAERESIVEEDQQRVIEVPIHHCGSLPQRGKRPRAQQSAWRMLHQRRWRQGLSHTCSSAA
jgi:hypothetical protein